MGLIKSTVQTATKTALFSMADIEQQARGIIARAKQQASQLLEHAQQAGEEMKREARAQGLAAGYDEGMAKGLIEGQRAGHALALDENREGFTQAIGALTAAAGEIDATRRELDSAALRDVIGLSVKIAERVTKRQATYDPEIILANVTECLRLVVGTHDLRIALHPTQKEVLTAALPRLQLEFPSIQHVELTEDQTLAPGGCRIFTRQGQIDADLDTQLNRIASELVPGT